MLITAVAHSVSQLENRWGKHGADTIWSTCGTKVLLGSISDPDTLDRASKVCGTAGDGDSKEPVVPPELLRMLPDWWALVIRMNLRPVIVKVRPVWRRLAYRLGRYPLPVPVPRPFPLRPAPAPPPAKRLPRCPPWPSPDRTWPAGLLSRCPPRSWAARHQRQRARERARKRQRAQPSWAGVVMTGQGAAPRRTLPTRMYGREPTTSPDAHAWLPQPRRKPDSARP